MGKLDVAAVRELAVLPSSSARFHKIATFLAVIAYQ
jgi:hypothetical protein